MNCEGPLSLIVALDYSDLASCRKLLEELRGLVKIYKIGSELFTAHGWQAVELVKKSGAEVFLDLKLHDIPTTVARTSRVIARHGVLMFNVHSLGGLQMMRAARSAVEEECRNSRKPILLGVTILTSLEENVLSQELGITRPLRDEVVSLAGLVKEAGLDGVVASPEEIEILRTKFGKEFVIVTPGIRPADSDANDQRRSLTPREAVERGASYLVVGRPITAAPSPQQATREILQSLA